MRWLLALLTIPAVALLVRAAPAEAPAPAAGFPHLEHASRLEVKGAAPIACARCHPLDARGRPRGRPGHEACFGACHGPRPAGTDGRRELAREDGDRAELCASCHGGGGRIAYPPYALDPDFTLSMSHADHARVDGDCRRCHQDPARATGRRRPAHQRCVGCHQSQVRPAMTACTGCHRAAQSPVRGPTGRRGPVPVTAAFSHRRHAPRAGGSCRPCHDGAARATGEVVPSPGKDGCRPCHDGDRAFSMVEAACRRCHAEPARLPPRREPAAGAAPFSHQLHAERVPGCERCHALGDDGDPRPVSDHRACGDAGCHRDDFARLEPRTCRVCHVGSEPWRPLHVDRPPPPATEFGARFSHALGAHAPLDCERCHRRASASRQKRLPRDHGACTGEGCHAREGGPTPELADCGGCHQPALVAGRIATRRAARWSVRARFDHRAHDRDPRSGAALPCDGCHAGTDAARTVAEVPTPAKARCAGCHDGDAAFKMTGHGCARCHTAAAPAQNGQSAQR